VKQLVKTPCRNEIIKNAFLFSCFTGLRFSDVRALKWGDIVTDNDGLRVIKFTQQKTENLQVSDEALKFLPERNDAKNNDIIFPLSLNGYVNEKLKSWISAAGIEGRKR